MVPSTVPRRFTHTNWSAPVSDWEEYTSVPSEETLGPYPVGAIITASSISAVRVSSEKGMAHRPDDPRRITIWPDGA